MRCGHTHEKMVSGLFTVPHFVVGISYSDWVTVNLYDGNYLFRSEIYILRRLRNWP